MHGVFINYRTGDGDEAAALLEQGLSNRFGKERIFRATNSIQPGQSYPEELIMAVHNSAVLLAVMGPGWAHDRRLRDKSDWVRREILEAYASKITVIPVLKGRRTERLKAADLPAELERLADVQSLRLDPRDNEMDIRRIGDFLAELVPALKKADRQASRSTDTGAVYNTASDTRGTVTQSRNIDGDVGTVIKGNRGPVHTGKGDINQNTNHFSGDGATYIQGDNHGGISHRFGRARGEEEER
ncbi:toll/interleukin-1 receptor domain-containing protein [Actinoallomurus sp. NPDC050550]|uniref:toll/interleukin-1 receptor domain-containing protein n=1 Tax=Actinoallomurus sp. NPDC050550 TaxID=3154937 RepID=UPI0033EF6C2E